MPSGFLGAVGQPGEVKLWIILYEPSGPEKDQKGRVRPEMSREEMFEHVGAVSFNHYKHRKHRFKSHHENVRRLLNRCFRGRYERFEDQLRLTWLCNSVLCCLPRGEKTFPDDVERACVSLYLKEMAKLIPNAYVLPLGTNKKLARRLRLAEITPNFDDGAYHPGSVWMARQGPHRQRGLKTYRQAAKSFREHMGWPD